MHVYGRFLITAFAIFVGLSATAYRSIASESTENSPDQNLFLRSPAPTIYHYKFSELADALKESGIINIYSSNAFVNKTELASVCTNSHRLCFAEFLETISRQTGTTAKYFKKANRWSFEPPAMPLPYKISMAQGWRKEERGLYTAYIPKSQPVGMDIYIKGRFINLSEEELKAIRNEQAMFFAEKISWSAKLSEMQTVSVDGVEALYYECKAPIKDRFWRQWVFIKNGQAFTIVSTLEEENQANLLPEVKAMVASFHVIEPAFPFPGL